MYGMISGAAAFNQNLGNWVLDSSVNLTDMLSSSGMDCDNYSRTLAGWALTTSATGRTYGTNVSSLQSLLRTRTGSGGKGRTIYGDAVSSGTCGPTVFYSKSTGDLDDLATWGTNTIQWGTASQTNSRSFVVERSSNGKTFVALDSLAAAGNSHNANHYSYVDEHADLPEAYYRIKQVDENGSEHLSEICLVQTKSSKNSPMVSIYPNPAASVVFLSAGEKSLPYNWALYNTTGQLLASGSSDGGQASINLSNIGKGIYNLHIQGEGFLQNVKLLVNP